MEKIFKNRMDETAEINIDVGVIADFIKMYSQEEKIDFEKVIECFHTLEKEDKQNVLKRVSHKLSLLDTISEEIEKESKL